MMSIITKFHLWSVETGFAFDKVANGSVFFDSFGPERISGKTEKVSGLIGFYFNNDISPAS